MSATATRKRGAAATESIARLEIALEDARDLANVRAQGIRRCMEQGKAWSHPTTLGLRARLAAGLAEIQMLELLITANHEET